MKNSNKNKVRCHLTAMGLVFLMTTAVSCTQKKDSNLSGLGSENDQASSESYVEKIYGFFGLNFQFSPNEPAVSINKFNQVLTNMETSMGIVADKSIRDYYKSKIDVLSEDGTLESVTAPMWLAITEISNQMCHRLLMSEEGMNPQERSFFANVDFTATPANLIESERINVITTLTRAFWGRNPTSLEQTDLLQGFDESALNETTPHTGILVLCSSILASMPAQES